MAPTVKKAAPRKPRAPRTRELGILRNDPWLEPYAAAIRGRHQDALRRDMELVNGSGCVGGFADPEH